MINPDYMGAAEYEWGVFPKCIETMIKFGTNNETVWLHTIHNKPIYVVSANGCDIQEVKDCIDYLYFAPSLELHNTGMLPEISKSDHSSFYKMMQYRLVNDFKSMRTHGWLNVKKHFAWFVDDDMAQAFNSYCNSIKVSFEAEVQI